MMNGHALARRCRTPGSNDQRPMRNRTMERRPLSDSGLEVSVLGLGTWAMGGTAETWGHVDDRESIATIHLALDRGINLIDTAPIYGLGHSEDIVGKAISGRRDQVMLATKCGLLFPKSESQAPSRSLTPKTIVAECEESLRRLRTDFIDLYQCHWPDPNVPTCDTIGTLNTLREQGKIRAIGLSNFSVEQVALAGEFGRIHCIQPPFSMLHLQDGVDLFPYCIKNNIAVLPYSPLAKGLLTGKFNEQSSFEDIRARDPQFAGERFRRNLRLVEELRRIAQDYGKSVVQLVLNWTVHYPGVTAPLVGAKRPSQLLENVGGVGWTLMDGDRDRINELLGT